MQTVNTDPAPSLDLDDPGIQTDPWPRYAHYRAVAPVYRASDGVWYLFRHRDVHQALAAPDMSVAHPFRTTRRAFGPSMVDQDGEAHQRLRAIAGGSFRPKLVDEYQRVIIEPVVQRLLDELAGDVVDLAGEFAVKVPVRVFCAVMGLPMAEADTLYAALRPLIDHVDQGDVSVAEVTARRAWLRAYFQRVLARGAYGPGLIRMFATTDDGRTTEKDVLNNLMMLLAAGTETTGLAIGNVVACLLREESRYERLRADPGLVPAVINESLRLEPPLHFVTRFTTGPLALRDATIPAGAAVQICLGSANRDETQFERPDEWDPTRPGGQPVTFGVGRHRCLGFGLANRELEVVLRILVERVPGLRAAGDVVPPVTGRSFRGVRSLPVRLGGRRTG